MSYTIKFKNGCIGKFEALHHEDLSYADLQGADLHGADLQGVDLQGADFQGANLHGANLHGANLHGANLSSADLSTANLNGANLHGANLSSADLSTANLNGANLHGANLSSADLSTANLSTANLSSADLSCANLRGANLNSANLSGTNLSGADIDFSVWPLWCGSLGVKTDKRVAAQLLYHALDAMANCTDVRVRDMVLRHKDLLELANSFHRVVDGDCVYLCAKTKKRTKMDKQKYYVISCEDVEHPDADNDWMYISTKPAYGNMDKQPVIDGWAGSTNGISVCGYGEFDSVKSALEFIHENFDCRDGDENGLYDDFNQDHDIIHTFKLGLLHVMDEYETDDYMWEWLKDITGNESDSDLDKIWDRAQENAKENGCLFSGKGLDMLYARRDAVRHEREG